jgi:ABC-type nitrate/sulfonate/bicarbonate transport system permease component
VDFQRYVHALRTARGRQEGEQGRQDEKREHLEAALMRPDRLIIHSIQLALFASVLGAWYIATNSGVRSLLLPPPELVWREMQVLWSSGRLWSSAVVTLNSIWQAYSIAVIAGIAVGFLVSRSRALVRIFEPMLSGMFAVPLTLFFPLFVVFFGIGPESKVAYAAMQCFFPIALNTIAGFASVDELYLRASRAMGASSLSQFRYVYLPAALPVTITGLRIGFFICIAAVLGGETLAALSGVGKSIALSAELMETARLFAWIAYVVTLSVTLNLLALAAERRDDEE